MPGGSSEGFSWAARLVPARTGRGGAEEGGGFSGREAGSLENRLALSGLLTRMGDAIQTQRLASLLGAKAASQKATFLLPTAEQSCAAAWACSCVSCGSQCPAHPHWHRQASPFAPGSLFNHSGQR